MAEHLCHQPSIARPRPANHCLPIWAMLTQHRKRPLFLTSPHCGPAREPASQFGPDPDEWVRIRDKRMPPPSHCAQPATVPTMAFLESGEDVLTCQGTPPWTSRSLVDATAGAPCFSNLANQASFSHHTSVAWIRGWNTVSPTAHISRKGHPK